MLTKEPKKKAINKFIDNINLFLTLAVVLFIANVVLMVWFDSIILAFPAGLFCGLWIYEYLTTPSGY